MLSSIRGKVSATACIVTSIFHPQRSSSHHHLKAQDPTLFPLAQRFLSLIISDPTVNPIVSHIDQTPQLVLSPSQHPSNSHESPCLLSPAPSLPTCSVTRIPTSIHILDQLKETLLPGSATAELQPNGSSSTYSQLSHCLSDSSANALRQLSEPQTWILTPRGAETRSPFTPCADWSSVSLSPHSETTSRGAGRWGRREAEAPSAASASLPATSPRRTFCHLSVPAGTLLLESSGGSSSSSPRRTFCHLSVPAGTLLLEGSGSSSSSSSSMGAPAILSHREALPLPPVAALSRAHTTTATTAPELKAGLGLGLGLGLEPGSGRSLAEKRKARRRRQKEAAAAAKSKGASLTSPSLPRPVPALAASASAAAAAGNQLAGVATLSHSGVQVSATLASTGKKRRAKVSAAAKRASSSGSGSLSPRSPPSPVSPIPRALPTSPVSVCLQGAAKTSLAVKRGGRGRAAVSAEAQGGGERESAVEGEWLEESVCEGGGQVGRATDGDALHAPPPKRARLQEQQVV